MPSGENEEGAFSLARVDVVNIETAGSPRGQGLADLRLLGERRSFRRQEQEGQNEDGDADSVVPEFCHSLLRGHSIGLPTHVAVSRRAENAYYRVLAITIPSLVVVTVVTGARLVRAKPTFDCQGRYESASHWKCKLSSSKFGGFEHGGGWGRATASPQFDHVSGGSLSLDPSRPIANLEQLKPKLTILDTAAQKVSVTFFRESWQNLLIGAEDRIRAVRLRDQRVAFYAARMTP